MTHSIEKGRDDRKRKPADSSGSFYEFTNLCKKILEESSQNGKQKIIKDYLARFKGDVYLLIKLLMAGHDQRVYRLGDKQLVNVFAKFLPNADLDDMLSDLEQGDISDTLKKFFRRSGAALKWSHVTLKQVDEFLDKLTTVSKRDDQIKVLSDFVVDNLTPEDLKWVTRLIKQDLKIYAGPKNILCALDADAYNAFKMSNNLRDVVDRALGIASSSIDPSINLNPSMEAILEADSDDEMFTKPKKKEKQIKKPEKTDKEKKIKALKAELEKLMESDSEDDEPKEKKRQLDSSDEEELPKGKKQSKKKQKLVPTIKLMTPVKPQLAKACKSYEDAIKKLVNGFFIETKYDGERIQIHKDGNVFKYYSRNLKPVMPYKVAEVEKYILKSTSVDKVILDGEILLVDLKTGIPLPFGTLGIHKKTQFKNACVGIFLFDILYLEGKSLLDVELRKRRKLLEKIVNVIPNRVMVSKMVECTGSLDDREALLSSEMANAIKLGLEGLVLKDIKSLYEPNARRWMKMKKDYLKGMADSADLIVLGAYFGTGSKGGLMSVFLMGVYDEQSKTYKTVCKVGNGHDDETIERLNEELRPIMRKIEKDYSRLPDWIDCDRSLTPDFIVKDPMKSVVWEVSGAEFSESSKSSSTKHTAAGISIRFPRVTRIRDDKDPSDATTLKELIKLKNASARKTPAQLAELVEKENIKKKEKKRKRDEEDDDPLNLRLLDAPDDEEESDSPPIKKKQKNSEEKMFLDDSSDDDKKEKKKEKKKKPSKPQSEDEEEKDDEEDEEITDLYYQFGDLSTAQDAPGDKILAHCLDDSGRWTDRGTMGSLVRAFGDEPKETYEKSFKEGESCSLGSIQCIDISSATKKKNGKTWVCNIIGQKSGKRGAPPISYADLEKGFKLLRKFAKKKNATVHFAKFHSSVPNLHWPRVEKMLSTIFVKNDVEVTVYTRDKDDREKCKKFKKGSKQASSKSEESTKKEEKKEKKGPLHGVNAVISGYSESEQNEIAKKVESLGGTVTKKWEIFGETASTHLICESETQLYDKVQKLGGTIVTRKWVDKCEKSNSLVDTKNYIFEIKKKQESEPSKKAPKKEKVLKDIFTGCTVYLHGKVFKADLVKRYLIAYNALIEENFEKESITHVVTDSEWDYDLERVAKKVKGKVVRSSWVWESVNSGEIADLKNHQVKSK